MLVSRIFTVLGSVFLAMFLTMAFDNKPAVEAGSVSKKFMKGFIMGAYMAKHHKPVIVVTKKHG